MARYLYNSTFNQMCLLSKLKKKKKKQFASCLSKKQFKNVAQQSVNKWATATQPSVANSHFKHTTNVQTENG